MQSIATNTQSPTSPASTGRLTVTPVQDGLAWGVGAIRPQAAFVDAASQRALLDAVLASIVPVTKSEQQYSTCTDGRVPVRLLSNEPVPAREQLVGADTMVVFHMAEVLGPRFYRDPNAPLPERIAVIVAFLAEHGITACTHVACGAAAGYAAIVQNLIAFTKDARFIARQQALLPADVYDTSLRQSITAGYQDRVARAMYADWSDRLITDAVQHKSGTRAIVELRNDGRGQDGHVEEMIIRIKVDGMAVDEAHVAGITGGREVFGVNDTRMVRLARLVGRGQDQDFRMALMAAEDFTSGGHGTLAKDLPTYVVTAG